MYLAASAMFHLILSGSTRYSFLSAAINLVVGIASTAGTKFAGEDFIQQLRTTIEVAIDNHRPTLHITPMPNTMPMKNLRFELRSATNSALSVAIWVTVFTIVLGFVGSVIIAFIAAAIYVGTLV